MEEKIYKKGINDVFSGAVLCAFAAWYYLMATKIKIMKMLAATLLDASSVPKVWGILLFLLGILLIVRGFRGMAAAKKAGYDVPSVTFAERIKTIYAANSRVVLMFLALLLFIVLITPLGFLPSCFLFLFAEFNILQRKEDQKLAFSAILALVAALLIYVLFKYAFQMPLPSGILQGIF